MYSKEVPCKKFKCGSLSAKIFKQLGWNSSTTTKCRRVFTANYSFLLPAVYLSVSLFLDMWCNLLVSCRSFRVADWQTVLGAKPKQLPPGRHWTNSELHNPMGLSKGSRDNGSTNVPWTKQQGDLADPGAVTCWLLARGSMSPTALVCVVQQWPLTPTEVLRLLSQDKALSAAVVLSDHEQKVTPKLACS